MATNKIEALRKGKQMTQRQLAAAIGTSQQQIQRIEKGRQSPRFELAAKICAVLKEPMDVVFPATKKAWASVKKKGFRPEVLFDDKDFTKEMEQADVDMDPRLWFFKYRLRGGANGVVPISGIETDRLMSLVQTHDSSTPFVIFDIESTRVLLNRKHLLFCHFLFEGLAPERSEESAHEVKVYLADSAEPLCFDVEPDDSYPEDSEEMGQLGHLTCMAETLVEDHDVFHFDDVDGERVFLRAHDIAMISIPLELIEPDLLDDEDGENSVPTGSNGGS